MEISALQQFLVLAETLNFTQAAEKCFVTQPTLSRKIAVLENELGVRLFVRSRKSVMLTAEGSAWWSTRAALSANMRRSFPSRIRTGAGSGEA